MLLRWIMAMDAGPLWFHFGPRPPKTRSATFTSGLPKPRLLLSSWAQTFQDRVCYFHLGPRPPKTPSASFMGPDLPKPHPLHTFTWVQTQQNPVGYFHFVPRPPKTRSASLGPRSSKTPAATLHFGPSVSHFHLNLSKPRRAQIFQNRVYCLSMNGFQKVAKFCCSASDEKLGRNKLARKTGCASSEPLPMDSTVPAFSGYAEKGLLFFATPKCLFLDRAIGPSCFRPRHVFFSTSSFFSAPQ